MGVLFTAVPARAEATGAAVRPADGLVQMVQYYGRPDYYGRPRYYGRPHFFARSGFYGRPRYCGATVLRPKARLLCPANAVIVAVGVNTDGRREVLGMTTGHNEAEPFWVEFLRSLSHRGLRHKAGDLRRA